MNYDAKILEQFARRLYNKADAIVTISVIVGVLIGAAVFGYRPSSWGRSSISFLGLIIGAALGGGIGYWVGSERAFWFRLRAQQTLCQKQIEENTRKALEDSKGSE